LTITVLESVVPDPPIIEEATFFGAHPCTVRISIAPPFRIMLTVGMTTELPMVPPRYVGEPPEQRNPQPQRLPIRQVLSTMPDPTHALRCRLGLYTNADDVFGDVFETKPDGGTPWPPKPATDATGRYLHYLVYEITIPAGATSLKGLEARRIDPTRP
jgi:hypothetical protein